MAPTYIPPPAPEWGGAREENEMIRITSTPLRPRELDPLLAGDPPKGCAVASRLTDYGHPVSPPWPAIPAETAIEIETTNHWIWRATLESVRDADHWVVRITNKAAMPLPPVLAGEPYVLPNMSGDAWSRRPQQGQVLEIQGLHYKVTHKPKPTNAAHSAFAFRLAPVTAEAHATRPGRVKITDHTDPDPGNYSYYGRSIGRIVQVGSEYLHIERITRQPYGSGEGDEIFGYITWGVGHFVPAAKAAKLQAAWQAKEKVRCLELQLRVAQNDMDYGGNPAAVPGLQAALEEARKAAKGK